MYHHACPRRFVSSSQSQLIISDFPLIRSSSSRKIFTCSIVLFESFSSKEARGSVRAVTAIEMEQELQAALVKVGVFVLVQALVYLILSQSSAVFSRTKSLGLRPARSPSLSARRMLAMLSDLPLAGEPSPVARTRSSSSSSSSRLLAADLKED